MRHKTHRMHANSLAVDLGILQERERQIVRYLQTQLAPMSDREIAEGMGFPHKAMVQPRLTILVQKGILAEGPSVKDPVTKMTVRTLSICCRIQANLLEVL